MTTDNEDSIMGLSSKQIENTQTLLKMPARVETDKLLEAHVGLLKYLGKYTMYKALMKSLPPILFTPGALLGVEVEVEGVEGSSKKKPPHGWTAVNDGSLRNNGAEFLSCPIEPEAVRSMLAALLLTLRYGQEEVPDFSWRTSIHVHLNVRQYTVAQVATLVLAYLVFEEAIFAFVGEDRKRGNFCVPLFETHFGPKLRDFFAGKLLIESLSDVWNKYSALNLIPVTGTTHGEKHEFTAKGTVEFRHMGGTKELGKLINWFNIILSLAQYCQNVSFTSLKKQVLAIKTPKDYANLRDQIFQNDLAEVIFLSTTFPDKSLSFAKECLTKHEPIKIPNKELSGFYVMLNKKMPEPSEGNNGPKKPSVKPKFI